MKIKWIFQVIEKTCSGDVVWATFSELRKAKQYLKENDFNESDYFKILLYKVDSEEYKELRDTGYKDANGIEIYEGDLLFKGDKYPITIEFKDGYFKAINADRKQGYRKIEDDDMTSWKVLGDIYTSF